MAGPNVGAVLAKLDPTGIRPTIIVAAVVLGLYLGSQLLNSIIPVPGVGPGGLPGPGGGQPVPTQPGDPTPTQPPVGPGPTQPPVGPGPVQPGQSVDIGPFRMTLLSGWQAGQTQSGGFRIFKGNVAIDLIVIDTQGAATDLYARYMNEVLATQSTGFGATQPTTLVIAGAGAARGAYNGIFGEIGQIEGEVTTIVHQGKGYIFDTWGSMGTLGDLLVEADRMLDTMVLN